MAIAIATMNNIRFRSIVPNDFESIRELHEEFFPVKYNDSFYIDSCNGKGMRGQPLYTCIACDEEDNVIGFLFGQFFDLSSCEEHFIIDSKCKVNDVFYILTLGVRQEYRRTGLASELLKKCCLFASSNTHCGAVYLHVLYTNMSAIQFYEKNAFTYFSRISGKG